MVSKDDSRVGVLLGNGDGGFAPKVDYPVGTQPGAVAAADLNGDGRSDLAIANAEVETVSVLLNTCLP
ncbi:FG-GAP repeat domain-containing protein [Sorangium sp. So ce1153]|uniref:FG-GAP repeat domain-containing protein n=1 Tax=Sorangium sp. So ce1153 TaxID=3133333 RepID=UPI003F6266CE